MTEFSPREIVSELDRFIVGQADAKRAVAIALRNRWRRQQVDEKLRPEITPKNILMIGPTGVGKTEIARRLARLATAPFIKVEATKFTEVGYVGKDVDSIIRDLADTYDHTKSSQLRYIVNPPGAKVRVHQHLDLGQGEIDWDSFFATLADMNFDGVLSNCVFAWEDRAEDSARSVLKQTKDYVAKYWK